VLRQGRAFQLSSSFGAIIFAAGIFFQDTWNRLNFSREAKEKDAPEVSGVTQGSANIVALWTGFNLALFCGPALNKI